MKKIFLMVITLVITAFVMVSSGFAADYNALTFEKINAKDGTTFYCMEMANNIIVISANSGKILVSKDEGETWIEKKLDTEYDLIELSTDGKQFVIRDANSNLFISQDAEKWNTAIRVTDKTIEYMKYIDGYFWLITEDTLFKSKDAVNWESFASNSSGLVEFAHDGKGLYLAIINNGLYKSSDLVDFEKCTEFGDKLASKITYNNGKFIIGCCYGYMAETVNGEKISFNDKFAGNYYSSNMCGLKLFNGNVYACDSDGKVRKITESISNTATLSNPLSNFRSDNVQNRFIVTPKDKVVVCNFYGQAFVYKNKFEKTYDNYTPSYKLSYVPESGYTYLMSSMKKALIYSGGKLVKDAQIDDLEYGKVIYDDEEYVIKGSTRYTARSKDGLNFTAGRTAGNAFVANLYESFNNKITIWTNGDGFSLYTYIDNQGYVKKHSTRFNMNTSLVYNNKLLLAGEFGEAYVIDSSWNVKGININKKTVNKIIAGDGKVIALHSDNTISVSSDLENWTNTKINTNIKINDIAYSSDGIYMAVGNTGLILTTSDFNTWYVNEIDEKVNLDQIIFDGTDFVCVGNSGVILRTNGTYNSEKIITADKVNIDKDTIRVFVNNELIMFDQNPVVEEGRTLVPLRQIFEALGCEIKWEEEIEKITAKNTNGITVELTLGNTTAKVNGKDVKLDVAPHTLNDRTLVPLRFIAESMNTKVVWEDYSATVYVDKI